MHLKNVESVYACHIWSSIMDPFSECDGEGAADKRGAKLKETPLLILLFFNMFLTSYFKRAPLVSRSFVAKVFI